MSERLEHELVLLNHGVVDVVRPGFGTQSDCFSGYLTVQDAKYPPQFHVQCAGQSLLFTVEDVVRIDPPPTTDERNQQPIIRLKGPNGYSSRLNPVHA